MNVSGTWTGEYTFEETAGGGGKAVAGTVVSFTMELTQGWLGSVTGKIKEDPRVGFAEEGFVKGKLRKGKENHVLQFDKMMPVLRAIHERSRLSLEQWTERYKITMDLSEAHPKIDHIGDVSADGNSIEGTWLMQELRLPVPGSGNMFYIPKLAGTWKILRKWTTP